MLYQTCVRAGSTSLRLVKQGEEGDEGVRGPKGMMGLDGGVGPKVLCIYTVFVHLWL